MVSATIKDFENSAISVGEVLVCCVLKNPTLSLFLELSTVATKGLLSDLTKGSTVPPM
uniref:Uncharacterized protein n=1 Tax=uncultured marine virus TaxID=186617 RepID=A0A0F7L9P1_9VIRU|nr:hypothetical protein [uncultured marine virus]